MATIYKCDRCDKEFTEKGKLWSIAIPRTYMGSATDCYNKDLCDNCVKQLEEFVRPLPRLANK